jgi:hypothetical protein
VNEHYALYLKIKTFILRNINYFSEIPLKVKHVVPPLTQYA